jgi:chromosome segregation ATPase
MTDSNHILDSIADYTFSKFIEPLEHELTNTRSRVDTLHNNVSAVYESHGEHSEQVKKLEQSVESYRQENEQLQKRLDDLDQRIAQLVQMVTTKKKRFWNHSSF